MRVMRVSGRSRERADDGAAAVEFALVLPVLLVLIFGIVQYGLYFWTAQGVSAAARDAARRASVGDPVTCADFRTMVTEAVAHLGDESTTTITRTYTSPAGTARATGAQVEIGDKVQVGVVFASYDLQIPLLPLLADGLVTERVESRVDFKPDDPEICT